MEKTEPSMDCLALFASYTKKRLFAFVRNKCIKKELDELGTTYEQWEEAKKRFQILEKEEAGIANECETEQIESHIMDAIKSHPMIENTFSNEDIDFKMVNTDNVIATQLEVLTDYVDQIIENNPKPDSEEKLLKYCLTPEKKVYKPRPNSRDAHSYFFSSQSTDLRYLGGYLKRQLSREEILDLKVAGFPVYAVMLFVGYGSFQMSAYNVDGRIILQNGFHRMIALREQGIKKMPILLINVSKYDFPNQLHELKKDYLLNDPRPVLIKDFSNDSLIKIFKQKPTRTILKLNWEYSRVTLDYET